VQTKAFVIFGFLLAALAAFAVEKLPPAKTPHVTDFADEKIPLLKAGNESYTNVIVTRVTTTDIFFTHAGGMGNEKLKNLSPELRKHFQFDSTRAKDDETKQIEANARYVKIISAPKPKAKKLAGEEPPPQGVDNAFIRVTSINARSFLHQSAPPILAEKWITSQPDVAGKFVLIDFWATWCGPCRESIPHLNALAAKYADKLVIVGLSDEPEDAIKSMTSPKIEYSIATDTQRRTLKTVEVRAIPHAILIDPRGIVRFEGMPHYLTEEGLDFIFSRYPN
jgi:cytochrome c biogenesis protein CcmG, thiol:disulfide interchange protein DsbE